jgi:integrase
MPANVRSGLRPYYHKMRGVWYARGTFPQKDAQGNVIRRRGFRGPAFDTRTACQAECDRLNTELEHDAKAGALAPPFENAAAIYLQLGGDGRFLTDRLLDEIGQIRCNLIDDAVMTKAARKIYPTAKPATLNRQLYTPVISVLRMAAKGQPWKPDLSRPKGYSKLRPAKSPPDDWYAKLFAACDPQVKAVLLACTMHRLRAGEAIRLKPGDFDPTAGTLIIERTKNGEPVFLRLAAPVIEAIQAYNWQAGPGLFGTLTVKNRRGLYRRLERSCKRAEIPYFPPHKAGSHAFAKRLLAAGKSLAHVKAAGRWKTIRVVAELYGHLEHSEVAQEATAIGEQWLEQLPSAEKNVLQFDRQAKRATVTKR